MLLAIEGRLAKAQESLKADLAEAQKSSELRQEKAQESLKADLAEAQKSIKEFIVARQTGLMVRVLAATFTGAGFGVSLFYWGGWWRSHIAVE